MSRPAAPSLRLLVVSVAFTCGCSLVVDSSAYSAGGGGHDASLVDDGVDLDTGRDTTPLPPPDTTPPPADTACADNEKPCDGVCRRTDDDKYGCALSSCAPCAFANATANGCNVTGSCRMGPCITGYADCNSDTNDGCESHVDVDAFNCGSCGATCTAKANSTAKCAAGKCAIAACSAGFDDCNKTLDDGCEVHTDVDPKNCGGCGTSCATVSHTTMGCTAGGCVVAACSAGFLDCDGNVDDGCECGFVNGIASCGAGPSGDAGPDASDADADASVDASVDAALDVSTDAGDGGAASICTFGGCSTGFADCNHDLARDGCEVDVTSDPAHCGSCSLNCDGGACVSGVCQPLVLAKSQAEPGELTQDRDYLYWSNFGAGTTPGSIASVAKGGGATITLAPSQDGAWGIVAEGATLYWSIAPSGSTLALPSHIGKAAVDGSASSTLVSTTGKLRGMAIDVGYVYWAGYEANAIYRMSRLPGATTVETVASGGPGVQRPNAIVVDDVAIYWTNEGTPGTSGVGSIAATGSIASIAKGAATGTLPKLLATALARPRGIALDAVNVYWTNTGTSSSTTDGSVARTPKDGSVAVPVTLASGIGVPRELAVDATSVFFSAFKDGKIYRVAKTATSATPDVLATGQVSPIGVAVDAKYVYWLNFGTAAADGTVNRLVKP